MQREVDEAAKFQAREAAEMSMRSPASYWINESLQRIGGQVSKKSVSSERKNPTSGQSLVTSSTNQTNSTTDFNKIFKP
jgi:hypothetical protein